MIVVVLIVVGLALGSFCNALVWRLHEQAKIAKSKKSKKTKARLKKLSIFRGHSMCPSCGQELAVRDLLPVFSWLWLRGKCRYCQKQVAKQYPLVEIIVPGLFVFSYYFWPLGFSGVGLFQFILWLAFIVGFTALSVYDLRWKLLPNRIVFPLIGLAAWQALIMITVFGGDLSSLLGAVYGVLIAAGFFFVLFEVSRGRWIGGGDVKLGVILGLILAEPAEAVLMLFIASLAGTIASLPFMIFGHMNRRSQVPFGPFLMLATVITYLFGAGVITWYKNLFIG